jgi:hypothetical protein
VNWDQAKELPLGHPWNMDDLRYHFRAVWGGVAFPGKNPGFAVVAGLRPVQQKDVYEVHVLAEAESPDLGELLRQCRALGSAYHIGGLATDEAFRWLGDWRNAAAGRVVQEVNGEGRPFYGAMSRPGREQLQISSTPILDMKDQPYAFMLSLLRQNLAEGRKQLFLHGSRMQHYLTAIQPEDIFQLQFGAFPAIEAVSFVVAGLRDHAEQLLRARLSPRPQAKSNDLFKRDRFYKVRR